MASHDEETYKLLLVGDPGVGKSCLLLRFADDTFTDTYITSIGIDFKIRHIDVDDKPVKLQIWDMTGQDRFRRISQSYYRGAHGIIIAYDTTDLKSFNDIKHWLEEIERNALPNVRKILVGTKSDLVYQRQVDEFMGKELADSLVIPWVETSAKLGINVDEAFLRIARDIKLSLASTHASNDGVRSDQKKQKDKGCALC